MKRPSHVFRYIDILNIISCFPLWNKHVFGSVQVSVAELRLYPQQVAHQRVNVNQVKGIYCQVFLKVRPDSPEEGFHVHVFIIKAVFPSVVVQRYKLYGHKNESFHEKHDHISPCKAMHCCLVDIC